MAERNEGMREFEEAKERYQNTPVPEELAARVAAGIQEGRKRHKEAEMKRMKSMKRWIAAAACFAVLLVGLNVSPTLAKAASEVPVLGGLFRVLTVASYETSEDGINYRVTVPGLESDGETADRVNAAIQEKVDQHMEKARQDWEDYKDAFFATGGTEEDWADREMDVYIDYEVKRQTDTQVSFVVTLAEGWVASMEERYYYNLDLSEDRELTLKDLLGENWVEICNESIREQIEASKDEEGFTFYFAPEDGGFTTVDETTDFYVKEDGTIVAAFPKYSIAAGAAGIPEFEISRTR